MATLLERYKMTAEVIDGRVVELAELVEAINDQQVKKAEAQVATQRRREAMEELDAWMNRFILVARQAFRDDRKQLEKLGLVVVLNPVKPEEEEASEAEQTDEASTNDES